MHSFAKPVRHVAVHFNCNFPVPALGFEHACKSDELTSHPSLNHASLGRDSAIPQSPIRNVSRILILPPPPTSAWLWPSALPGRLLFPYRSRPLPRQLPPYALLLLDQRQHGYGQPPALFASALPAHTGPLSAPS